MTPQKRALIALKILDALRANIQAAGDTYSEWGGAAQCRTRSNEQKLQ